MSEDQIKNPKIFPVLALKNTTIFPGTIVPIRAMREISVNSIEKAIREKSLLLTVSEKEDVQTRGGIPFPDRLSRTGTLTRIEKFTGNKDEGYNLILLGVDRFQVNEMLDTGKAYSAVGLIQDDLYDLDQKNIENLKLKIRETAKTLLEFFPSNTDSIQEQLESIEELSLLIHVCLSHLELNYDERIRFLETLSVKNRALMLLETIEKRIQEFKVKNEVHGRMSARLGKQQREAILREQLRTIQEELGERSRKGAVDYRQKIHEAGMPGEITRIALDEVDRMESLGNQSQESAIIRNYLDWMTTLPWTSPHDSISAEINLDHSKNILDEDHEGLDEVKRKIIQSLAVAKLRKTNRGQILLLVGPPGVGKTSLGQSVARAMNRKFTRVALGGVRDEAEIRGHRRTYIGAMPGRIIQAMKRTGSRQTVMLLDEIDKLGRGIHGDPTAALLEVLDPEQNSTFTDHYLDVPYDLSSIVFIATANHLESIPGPLLDRMDVIELSGYTTSEKNHIAKKHLIPKIQKELGMTEEDVILDESALSKTIASYTREAGVRDLNRKLNSIFRSVTEKVVNETEKLPIRIGTKEVEEILGKEKYEFETAEKIAVPGVATGLAWTPMGGEILFIESGLMPGKGNLILTGQLGEVMQESAQIALSLLRTNLSASVPIGDFENKDIHIHVPAGGIPKDGPSAGITMLSSLASSFLKQAIDPNLGMTGEITLRGSVMPVGGIKEKMIAAHQAGLKKIILSKKNERDLKDLPEEVRNGMEFKMVEKVSELLHEVFGIPQAISPTVADSVGEAVTSIPLM
jgi:ATP-dependent Lon protease